MALKLISHLIIFVFISINLNAQNGNVGIGTQTPINSAILDLTSQNQGFLPPRMNQVQRDSILNPVAGLLVFNTDDNAINYFTGTAWTSLGPKSLVTNSFHETINANDEPDTMYTLSVDYVLIQTDSISVNIPGKIVVMGELNLEPTNNVNIIYTFSTGNSSIIPSTSLSRHSLPGNKSSHVGRNAIFDVSPGNHVFNILIRLDPTPSSATIFQYFSQITLMFIPS